MSILKVARMGHPVLRARAKPLDPSEIKSPRVQQLIDDMFETMQEYSGVGLAAPQVHESLRLFVAGFAPNVDDEEEDDEDEGESVPLMGATHRRRVAAPSSASDLWALHTWLHFQNLTGIDRFGRGRYQYKNYF